MKVPLSWLREYVDLPAVTAHEVADKLTAAGLKLESISSQPLTSRTSSSARCS